MLTTLFYLSNYFICLVGYFNWFFTVRHTAGKWVLPFPGLSNKHKYVSQINGRLGI